jgi:hypothetical protein
MPNSAGNVGSGNEGKTDMDRGMTGSGNVNKNSRKTGQVGNVNTAQNPNTEDGNARRVSDPRLS